jgi:hypothetical protein
VTTAVSILPVAAPERVPTRFEIPTPATVDPASFALSSDGRQLAFVATAMVSVGSSYGRWIK